MGSCWIVFSVDLLIVDPRTLQVLMGHKSISPTMIYMQVTCKKLSSISSLLDLLNIPIGKRFEKEASGVINNQ